MSYLTLKALVDKFRKTLVHYAAAFFTIHFRHLKIPIASSKYFVTKRSYSIFVYARTKLFHNVFLGKQRELQSIIKRAINKVDDVLEENYVL